MNRSSRGPDESSARRLLIGLVLALVAHLVGLALVRNDAPPAEVRVRSVPVTIAIRTPPPTPRPTVPPTPPPVPTPRVTPKPHYTLAPKIVVKSPARKAAAVPRRHVGGAAAPLHVVHVVPKPEPSASAAPESVVAGTKLGAADGGSGTGAGAGVGDGGLGGTGSGTGATGNGTGGAVDTAPCGDVYLLPGQKDFRRNGTVVQEVVAKVVLKDGTTQVGRFPYPFTYPNEARDPFVHDSALDSDGGVPVQQPPAGANVATYPAAVRAVLSHTNPATGHTTMPECTADAPPPA